jgi:acetyl-CoA carboxylase/biotin carboxylase 1
MLTRVFHHSSYFYWRLRRRLAEEDGIRRLAAADSSLDRKSRLEIVNSVLSSDVDAENDQAVASALEKGQTDLLARVKSARSNSIAQSVAEMLANGDSAAVLEGLKKAKGDSLTSEQLALISSIFA